MSLAAQHENAKSLAKLLQIEDEEAADLLNVRVAVQAAQDKASQFIAHSVANLLDRTVARVAEQAHEAADVGVAIGGVRSTGTWPVVHVGVADDEATISCALAPAHDVSRDVPEILLLIAACHAAAMAIRLCIGGTFPLAHSDTIRLPLGRLTRQVAIGESVKLGKMYLAGAGAIGNGFLWALSLLNVEGELHVIDPKNVAAGNLNRCLWFGEAEVGLPKAEALTMLAQSALPNLKLVPRIARVQQLEERSSGPWLERLIVAVDSRRARRSLQAELPRDVFDASTTGIEEIVMHFNRAASGGACLSCIYTEDLAEATHEAHVAQVLGVGVEDVLGELITIDAAKRMVLRHPQLDPTSLVGTAYDSLFKTLCATGHLGLDESRTVLAPFSFVSVLAGAYLALELVLRCTSGDLSLPFNYWRVSPWTSPVLDLQSLRPSHPACETCGHSLIRATVKQLWGQVGETHK